MFYFLRFFLFIENFLGICIYDDETAANIGLRATESPPEGNALEITK